MVLFLFEKKRFLNTRLQITRAMVIDIHIGGVYIRIDCPRNDIPNGEGTMRLPVPKSRFIIIALIAFFFLRTEILAETSHEGHATAKRNLESPWLLEAKIKKHVNSHTSYEFGNPFPPYQAPLSRLEFPLQSVWGGAEVRRSLNRFSAGVEFLTSFSNQETGRFKDSDWEDDGDPSRLSIYGEANCRLEPSHQIRADLDAQIADLLGLSKRIDLRPVIGYRWQRFSLVTHDGTQSDGLTIVYLPGDGIAFEQEWAQYFVGMKFGYDFGPLFGLHRLKLQTQLDWGEVKGENEDRHLLRAFNRTTIEDTTGDAWHGLVGIVAGLKKNLDLGLEVDYLSIKTTGTHELRTDLFSFSFSHGVEVWSEQLSMLVKLGYRF
ncbi:MAG: omptin family outer membrane protease [Desulfobacteraceae bacterium]|nr:MAG: omptin family outer membrane protease [Desulfobacteraceae bacterium]